MIRIPRYKNLETGERRGQIIVDGLFNDVSKYPKKKPCKSRKSFV